MSDNRKLSKENCTIVSELCIQITEKIKSISSKFNDDNQFLLKHCAAAAIHMSFFTRDILQNAKDTVFDELNEAEEKFLNKCGCKDELSKYE